MNDGWMDCIWYAYIGYGYWSSPEEFIVDGGYRRGLASGRVLETSW